MTARRVLTMAFTTYLWRVGNVVAGLSGADALGDMTDQTMLDMAKKIDYRATRRGRRSAGTAAGPLVGSGRGGDLHTRHGEGAGG